jgi:hypothetical protein
MNPIDELVEGLTRAGLSGKWGEPSNPRWVRIWARDQWRCGYCGEDLLKDVIRMHSAQIDHLLPASPYPEYRDTDKNFVLSCYCCNQIKRDFDPLGDHEEMKESPLEQNRDRLIDISRKHIETRLKAKKAILEESRNIVAKYRNQA